jgi:predicted nucleic acid-binding protein
MPTYFDSSVVVSLFVDEPLSARASAMWLADEDRVSSSLLQIECINALRRASSEGRAIARGAEPRLGTLLDEVSLKQVDDDIVEIVRKTPAFARCRSLDVVHLATALHFAERSDEPVVLATFDALMAEVAAAVGLKVTGIAGE